MLEIALPRPAQATARPAAALPGWALPASAVALAGGLFLAFTIALQGCGDTHWHLAAGRWMLAHGRVPAIDPFSVSFAGRPWLAHEWLAEVVMAAAYAGGGWSGLALLFAAAFAGLMLAIGATIGRHLPPLAVLVALVLVATVLAPTALARPHVLAWGLLAAWLAILLRARGADRAPPAAAALVMLVWANLHGSFLFGLVLVGALGLEAMIARPAAWRGWAGFGLLALVAALATPHGIAGLLFPLQVSAMRSLALITEWGPTRLGDQPGFALLIATGLWVIAARGVRVPPVRALIVLACLWLALDHARHQAVFAIVAPLLLAESIGRGVARQAAPTWARPAVRAILACGLVAAVARLAIPIVPLDSATNPAAAMASVPAAIARRPVFNSYDYGGPLILRGIRPYIDGRADMYGDAFLFDYARIAGGDLPAFERAVARYGIAWTILPTDSPLAAKLDRTPGWRRSYADRWAVVHFRVR